MINKAIKVLQNGGLVAIPTETVYGLGADASNPEALSKIFKAKQRPQDHPLIVHIGNVSQLSLWAREIPESALLLAEHFWPGPLTLILKKAAHVSDLITGGQDTIGLRIPSHPVALELLNAYQGGIAAPSANRFGRISPTTAEAVREELGDAVDLVLEGGQCEVGVESTIVDLTGKFPVILRPGMITGEQISAVLHQDIHAKQTKSPRVSGSHDMHYAPQTKTYLVPKDILEQTIMSLPKESLPAAILSLSPIKYTHAKINIIAMPQNPKDYAHELYFILRNLDKKGYQQIIIEAVPEGEQWDAIRDRIQRASQNSPHT